MTDKEWLKAQICVYTDVLPHDYSCSRQVFFFELDAKADKSMDSWTSMP